MKIKLVITDLDGTLLKPHQEVSKDENSNLHGFEVPKFNVKAIQNMKKHNISLAIATGRMQIECKEVLKNIENISKYWITQNGVFLQNNNLDILKENTFTFKEGFQIYEYLQNHGFNPYFSNYDTFYLNEDKLESVSYQNLLKILKSKKQKVNIKYAKFTKELFEKVKISNFGLDTSVITLKQMEDVEKFLNKSIYDAEVFITSGNSMDIVPKNISKATAIKHLAQELNLELNEIAFVGDSGNDLDALKLLENSFVMSHARKQIKVHANYEVNSFSEAIEIILKKDKKVLQKNENRL